PTGRTAFESSVHEDARPTFTLQSRDSLRGGGEGGTRTLGTLLGYGALAKRCFRPLSHLTKLRAGVAFRAGLALGRTICFGIGDCQQSVAPDAMESCRGSC